MAGPVTRSKSTETITDFAPCRMWIQPSLAVASPHPASDRVDTTPTGLIISAISLTRYQRRRQTSVGPSHYQPIIAEPAGDDPGAYPGMNPEKSGNRCYF